MSFDFPWARKHFEISFSGSTLLVQGILFSTPECLRTPVDVVRLWLHEASRVYGDKLTDDRDMETFVSIKNDVVKKHFEVSAWNIWKMHFGKYFDLCGLREREKMRKSERESV